MHIHAHTRKHTHTHTHTHAHTLSLSHAHTQSHTHVYTHIHTHAHVLTHSHTYTHTQLHAHMPKAQTLNTRATISQHTNPLSPQKSYKPRCTSVRSSRVPVSSHKDKTPRWAWWYLINAPRSSRLQATIHHSTVLKCPEVCVRGCTRMHWGLRTTHADSKRGQRLVKTLQPRGIFFMRSDWHTTRTKATCTLASIVPLSHSLFNTWSGIENAVA